MMNDDYTADASRMRSFHVRLPSQVRAILDTEAKGLTTERGHRVTAGAVARVMLTIAAKQSLERPARRTRA